MVPISGHWLYARTLTYADLTLAAPCKQVLHFTGEQTQGGLAQVTQLASGLASI